MSRKAIKKSKHISRKLDVKYSDETIMLLINMIMKDGKKSIACDIVYNAIEAAVTRCHQSDSLKQYLKHNEIDLKDKKALNLAVMHYLIKQVRPELEVKSRRVGGANYQIPFPVQGNRQTHLSLMWFIESSRSRRGAMGKPFAEAMAAEIVDAVNETGGSVKKKQDVHAMAEANKAFAHFAKY